MKKTSKTSFIKHYWLSFKIIVILAIVYLLWDDELGFPDEDYYE